MPALLAYVSRTPVRDVQPREWARRNVLDSVRSQQREIDAGEARKLTLATDWADLHRADAVDEQTDPDGVLRPASVFDFATEPVLMSGVPVDDHCLAELATALRVSHGATRSYVEDGLEIRERLPRFWAKVQAGKCKVGKARAVAQKTRSLSDEAADYVDRHLAPFAGSLGAVRIKSAVDAAILKFDPARAAAEAAAAADNRGVWFDHEHGGVDLVLDDSRPNGTSRMEAVCDTPTMLAFEDALKAKAQELKILGDESSEQVRMSKSIGILADSQYALDITASADAALEEEHAALVEVRGASRASKPSTPADRRPNRVRTPLGIERPIHIHLHTSTDVARVQASGLPHAASPISAAAVERWISELAPGARVKVTPVVDLNRHHAVDAYEAPPHIRDSVEARDHTCVFPFCTNRGRFDLDHIDPYVDPDEGGPPGQTSNQNMAKLCRYHHRVKTHGGWTYTRVGHPDDLHDAGHDDWDWILDADPPTLISAQDRGGPPAAYKWTSPMGHPYLVTGTGTYPLE